MVIYGKKEILISLEIVSGQILKDLQLEDGTFSSGSPIVDNDPIINKLDEETNKLLRSFISDDENSKSRLKFDYEIEEN